MEVVKSGQGRPINIDYMNVTEIEQKDTVEVKTKYVNPIQTSNDADTEHPKEEEVSKAVEKLNKLLEGEKVHAEYSVHEKLNNIMIKIVNNETNEVVLEVPPKKILDMIAFMMESVGLLVDEKA